MSLPSETRTQSAIASYFSILVCPVDKLHSLYCDLLRRLDDSSDEVRLTLTKTLEAYTQ